MEFTTTILDQALLLLTGLTAVYLIYRFIQAFKEREDNKKLNEINFRECI